MRVRDLFLIPLAIGVAGACAEQGAEVPAEQTVAAKEMEPAAVLSVFTVNYPLRYFAERIGGELVEVSFPAPADVDPAFWAPDPETVVAYQQADLILLNGVSYAKWIQRVTLPAGKMVDTSAAFEERWIPLQEGPVHTHGPEGEHSHKGYAFTTWLDPRLATEQARAVARALDRALPAETARIAAGLEGLTSDLEDLDRRLAAEAERLGDEPLLLSHPVYQYLLARYGLNGRSVHWEPGEQPDEDQWQELADIVESHPAQWMVWESEPIPETAKRLADLGIESIVYAPCGNAPDAGDLLAVMNRNVASLQAISRQK